MAGANECPCPSLASPSPPERGSGRPQDRELPPFPTFRHEFARLVPARRSERRLFVPMPPPRRRHWLSPSQLKRLLAATGAGRDPPLPARLRARVLACGADVGKAEAVLVRWLAAGMTDEEEDDNEEVVVEEVEEAGSGGEVQA
jgi:hypothetical protein